MLPRRVSSRPPAQFSTGIPTVSQHHPCCSALCLKAASRSVPHAEHSEGLPHAATCNSTRQQPSSKARTAQQQHPPYKQDLNLSSNECLNKKKGWVERPNKQAPVTEDLGKRGMRIQQRAKEEYMLQNIPVEEHSAVLHDLRSRFLTEELLMSPSLAALHSCLPDSILESLNAIHVAAAYRRLAQLQKGRHRSSLSPHERRCLAFLHQKLDALSQKHCQSMRPREISGVLWAAATAGHTVQPPLLDSLMQELLSQFKTCNEIDVSNVVWSLATHLRSSSSNGLQELLDGQEDLQHGKVPRANEGSSPRAGTQGGYVSLFNNSSLHSAPTAPLPAPVPAALDSGLSQPISSHRSQSPRAPAATTYNAAKSVGGQSQTFSSQSPKPPAPGTHNTAESTGGQSQTSSSQSPKAPAPGTPNTADSTGGHDHHSLGSHADGSGSQAPQSRVHSSFYTHTQPLTAASGNTGSAHGGSPDLDSEYFGSTDARPTTQASTDMRGVRSAHAVGLQLLPVISFGKKASPPPLQRPQRIMPDTASTDSPSGSIAEDQASSFRASSSMANQKPQSSDSFAAEDPGSRPSASCSPPPAQAPHVGSQGPHTHTPPATPAQNALHASSPPVTSTAHTSQATAHFTLYPPPSPSSSLAQPPTLSPLVPSLATQATSTSGLTELPPSYHLPPASQHSLVQPTLMWQTTAGTHTGQQRPLCPQALPAVAEHRAGTHTDQQSSHHLLASPVLHQQAPGGVLSSTSPPYPRQALHASSISPHPGLGHHASSPGASTQSSVLVAPVLPSSLPLAPTQQRSPAPQNTQSATYTQYQPRTQEQTSALVPSSSLPSSVCSSALTILPLLLAVEPSPRAAAPAMQSGMTKTSPDAKTRGAWVAATEGPPTLPSINSREAALRPSVLTQIQKGGMARPVTSNPALPTSELQPSSDLHAPSHPSWLPVLVNQLVSMLPSLPDRPLVVVCTSLVKITQALTTAQAQVLMVHLLSRAQHFGAQDLANTLCSMARLSYRPSEAQMKEIAALVHRRLPSFKGDEIAVALYAFAKLRYQPPLHLQIDMCKTTLGQLSKCSLGHLALMTWAFSQLQWRPPAPWMEHVVTEVCERVQELQEQELATLLFGLSTFGYTPEQPEMAVLLERMQFLVQRGHTSTWQLTAFVTALARLRQQVKPSMHKATLRACMHALPKFSNQGLGYMLWAVAKLAIWRDDSKRRRKRIKLLWDVTPNWLAEVNKQVAARLPTLCATSAPLIIWALAKLHSCVNRPSPAWMAQFWRMAVRLLPHMQPRGLVAMLQASVWMRFVPQSAVMQAVSLFISINDCQLPTGMHTHVRTLIYRMGKLRAQKHWAFRMKGRGLAPPFSLLTAVRMERKLLRSLDVRDKQLQQKQQLLLSLRNQRRARQKKQQAQPRQQQQRMSPSSSNSAQQQQQHGVTRRSMSPQQHQPAGSSSFSPEEQQALMQQACAALSDVAAQVQQHLQRDEEQLRAYIQAQQSTARAVPSGHRWVSRVHQQQAPARVRAQQSFAHSQWKADQLQPASKLSQNDMAVAQPSAYRSQPVQPSLHRSEQAQASVHRSEQAQASVHRSEQAQASVHRSEQAQASVHRSEQARASVHEVQHAKDATRVQRKQQQQQQQLCQLGAHVQQHQQSQHSTHAQQHQQSQHSTHAQQHQQSQHSAHAQQHQQSQHSTHVQQHQQSQHSTHAQQHQQSQHSTHAQQHLQSQHSTHAQQHRQSQHNTHVRRRQHQLGQQQRWLHQLRQQQHVQHQLRQQQQRQQRDRPQVLRQVEASLAEVARLLIIIQKQQQSQHPTQARQVNSGLQKQQHRLDQQTVQLQQGDLDRHRQHQQSLDKAVTTLYSALANLRARAEQNQSVAGQDGRARLASLLPSLQTALTHLPCGE